MTTSHILLWKKSMFVFFSQLIRLITNVIIFVGIARLYGPTEYGQFSIAYTLAVICIVIADFGFDVLLTTEVAKNRNNVEQIGKRFFSMKLIFTGVSASIMFLIPSFQAFSSESRNLIYILIFYMVFTTFTNFFNAIFRGFEKFEYETKISFVTNVLLLTLLTVFGLFKVGLVYLMVIFVFARLLGVLLSALSAKRLIGVNILVLDFADWKNTVNKVLVFGLHFLFGNLYFQIDTILLGIWQGDHAVGVYQSAFKIMLLLLLIPEIIVSTLLPPLSRIFSDNFNLWNNTNRLLYKALFFSSIPIFLGLFFFAEQIIKIVFGSNHFIEAIPILKIFSLIVLIRFSVEPFAFMLTTSNRQKVRMYIVIIATIVGLILNSFIIPLYGIYGAAWVSLGVNIMVGAGYIIPSFRLFSKWTLDLRTLLVVALIITLVLLFHSSLTLISLSIVSYILFAYYIGFSGQDRKTLINNIFYKRI